MYYFSNSTDMNFDDAVASTKEALKRHHFAILAEIDLGKVLRRQLAVDFRPYVIISACSPQLVPQTIEADNEIGSTLATWLFSSIRTVVWKSPLRIHPRQLVP